MLRRLAVLLAALALPSVAQAQLCGGNICYFQSGGVISTPLLLPDGSAALPAVGPASEPTTGFYFTAGVARLSLAATQRMLWGATYMQPGSTDTTTLGGPTLLFSGAYLTQFIQGSKSKSLTDAGATVAVIRVPIASNGYQAGTVTWNAQSTDATDYRTTNGTIQFAGISKAAAPTCTVNVVGTDLTASSNANTLVCTWSNAVNSTNCDLSVTCTDNTAGTQTMTIKFRADMTTIAVLVFP
jgi:hypothetical protein